MKKSIGEKYFCQKSITVIEWVCIAVMVVSAMIATFVWGGGPTGLTLFGISAFLLIISRSSRVKDEEIDNLIKKMLEQNEIDINKKSAISTYDLKNVPTVKGKDGQLRSSNYVVSFFDISNDLLKITTYNFDLVSAEMKKSEYNLTGGYQITLVEEDVIVGKTTSKKANYLISDCFEKAIPVTVDDIDSIALIKKIC